jgi:hypothetical protein
MSGTVEQFEFVSPHAWLHVAIVNDKGRHIDMVLRGRFAVAIGFARLGAGPPQGQWGDREVGFRPMKDGSRGGQLGASSSRADRRCAPTAAATGLAKFSRAYRPQQ